MAHSRREKRFKWLVNIGKQFMVLTVPLFYNSYMWLVYHTSKKTYIEVPKLWEMTGRGENVLGAVWHQDGFISPFCHRGHDILTMVSYSSLGNILVEIFRKCHFIPVRGGSARGGKEALAELIEYMNEHTGVLCGMAVDGSRGPARKVQAGILLLAQATGAPIYPMRSWAKRKLLMPTWDKTLIPLPFNHMVFLLGDPLRVPPDADRAMIDDLKTQLEEHLNALVRRAEEFFVRGNSEGRQI